MFRLQELLLALLLTLRQAYHAFLGMAPPLEKIVLFGCFTGLFCWVVLLGLEFYQSSLLHRLSLAESLAGLQKQFL